MGGPRRLWHDRGGNETLRAGVDPGVKPLLICLGVGLAGSCAAAGATSPLVQIPEELRREYRVTVDSTTGCVTVIQAFWADPMGMGHEGCAGSSVVHTTIPTRVYDFLMAHADLFKLRAGLDELDMIEADECLGFYYLDFQQRYRDVRVIGGLIRVRLDPRRRIEMVGANVLPGLDLDVSPNISAEETRTIATDAIAGAIPSRTTLGELEIDRPRRWPLPEKDPPLKTAAPPEVGPWTLVCRATVSTTQSHYPCEVRVDLHTGEVLSKRMLVPSDPR